MKQKDSSLMSYREYLSVNSSSSMTFNSIYQFMYSTVTWIVGCFTAYASVDEILQYSSTSMQKIWQVPDPQSTGKHSGKRRTRRRRTQRKNANKTTKPTETNKSITPLPTNRKGRFILVDKENISIKIHWIDFIIDIDTEDETERKITIYKTIPFDGYYVFSMEDLTEGIHVRLLAIDGDNIAITNYLREEGFSEVNDTEEELSLSAVDINTLNQNLEERDILLKTELASHITMSLSTPGNIQRVRSFIEGTLEDERVEFFIEAVNVDAEEDPNWSLARLMKSLSNLGSYVWPEHEGTTFGIYTRREFLSETIEIITKLGFTFGNFNSFVIDTEELLKREISVIIRNREITNSFDVTPLQKSPVQPCIVFSIPYGIEDGNELIGTLYKENEDDNLALTNYMDGKAIIGYASLKSATKLLNKYPDLGISIDCSKWIEEGDLEEVIRLRNEFLQTVHEEKKAEVQRKKEEIKQLKKEEEEKKRKAREEDRKAWILEMQKVKADLKEEEQRNIAERKALEEEQIRYQALKSIQLSEEKEIEERKRISELTDEDLAEEISEICVTATESWDSLGEAYPKLKLYAGTINNIDGSYALLYALVNNVDKLETHLEDTYAHYIATCGNVDLSNYKFYNIYKQEDTAAEPLIRCPYCETCCNDSSWLEKHIKQMHKLTTPSWWKYAWTYLINSHKEETVDDYFSPRVCYKCSHCEFTNTSPHEVSRHIKKLHPHDKNACRIKGVCGIGKAALDMVNVELIKATFNPKPYRKPELYANSETQTEKRLKGSGENHAVNGLENGSAKCYMNSLFQALAACPSFRKSLNQCKGSFANSVRDIIDKLNNPVLGNPISIPDDIFEKLGFDTKNQEDPQEAFSKLIEQLESENKNGAVYNTFRIAREQTNSNNIPLDESIDIQLCKTEAQEGNANKDRLCKWNDLLENNLLAGGEKIVNSSNIVALYAMRTEMSINTPANGKEMYNIATERRMTMNGHTYETKAIIVHSGREADNGHYMAIVCKDNTWRRISDENITIESMPKDNSLVHVDANDSTTKSVMVFMEMIDEDAKDSNVNHTSKNNSKQRLDMPHGKDVYDILTESDPEEISGDDEGWDTILESDNDTATQETQSVNSAETAAPQEETEEATITLLETATVEPGEAREYYQIMMSRLIEISKIEEEKHRNLEAKLWRREVLESKYLRCLASTYSEDNCKDWPISEIGMLCTGVVPELTSSTCPCEFPGCNFNAIANKRAEHWIKHHGIDKESIPEVSLVNTYLGVLGRYGQAYLTNNKTGESRRIGKLLIECPVCREGYLTTCKNSWRTHTGRMHRSDLNPLMLNFGRYWGSEILGTITGNHVTMSDIIKERDVYACPYCEFCTTKSKRVMSHISNFHKDKQCMEGKYSIECRYCVELSTTPFYEEETSTSEILIPEDEEQDNGNTVVEEEQPKENPVVEEEAAATEEEEGAEPNYCTDSDDFDFNQHTDEPTDMVREAVNEMINMAENRKENEEEEDIDSIAKVADGAVVKCLKLAPLQADPILFKKAIHWSRHYGEFEFYMPKLFSSKRRAISEIVKDHVNEEAIPLIFRIANMNLGENETEKWLAINGAFSQTMYRLMEKVQQKLHLSGVRSDRAKPPDLNELEITYARLSSSRAASSKAARLLRKMVEVHDGSLMPADKTSELCKLENRCIKQLRDIDPVVTEHVFNCTAYEISSENFNALLDNMAKRDDMINYIDNALTKEMEECEASRAKVRASRVQALYAEDTKRAMRWYVTKESTPNCPLSANVVRDALARRWATEYSFEAPEKDENLWYTNFHLTKKDKKMFMKRLVEPYVFQDVIDTRKPFSANGPDGIGYGILQSDSNSGSILMMVISKCILKYGRLPSLWNRAKTIMIYKKGDPNEVKSWRPITINSAVYRTWTAAVALIIQDINEDNRLFHHYQKGFIRGIDGCMEHTQTIAELFNEACRRKKELHVITIDLEDAFGSIPHEYINEILKEMDFPEDFRRVIETSYKEAYTYVDINGDTSSELRITKGVKQGCPLSPLIFNFCLNPLLQELENTHLGFTIGNNEKVVTAQAYADDLVLFADNKAKARKLLNVVERFCAYSCLKINASKCRSMSYIISNGQRNYEDAHFKLNGERIPSLNLGQCLTYLGAGEAASGIIRHKGTEEDLANAETLIKQIMKSDLKVNQKIDAFKRFVIPGLDYTLTQGYPRLGDLEHLDKLMRRGVREHIKTASLPKCVCEAHWKDGGLSLQSLKVRADALRIKKLVALFNSPNDETRDLFYLLAESEFFVRGAQKAGLHDAKKYMDRKVGSTGGMITSHSGTSSIISRTNRSCVDLGIEVSYVQEDGVQKLAAKLKMDDGQMKYITDSSAITKIIMRNRKVEAREQIKEQSFHGHSFYNLTDNRDSNFFIGSYQNHVSDKVISFAIAARCEVLYTGWIAAKKNISSNAGPKCRYCGIGGKEYTLGHILNGCPHAFRMYTHRHNKVVDVIAKEAKEAFKGSTILSNSTVMINGVKLNPPLDKLKPDLIIYDAQQIRLVEVSCPFDMKKTTEEEEGNSGTEVRTVLDAVYETKKRKYEELRAACEAKFGRRCSTYICIVSSLGAVYKKTVTDMAALFNWNLDAGKKHKMDRMFSKRFNRKLCSAALYGSFDVFYKLTPRATGATHTENAQDVSPVAEGNGITRRESGNAVGEGQEVNNDNPPTESNVINN